MSVVAIFALMLWTFVSSVNVIFSAYVNPTRDESEFLYLYLMMLKPARCFSSRVLIKVNIVNDGDLLIYPFTAVFPASSVGAKLSLLICMFWRCSQCCMLTSAHTSFWSALRLLSKHTPSTRVHALTRFNYSRPASPQRTHVLHNVCVHLGCETQLKPLMKSASSLFLRGPGTILDVPGSDLSSSRLNYLV